MPTCLFYFPNTLLPKSEGALVQKMQPAWSAFPYRRFEAAEKSAVFSDSELAPYAPYQWLWMLLTGKDSLLGYAPYLRKGLGGQPLSHEVWHLAPYLLRDGRIEPCSLADDEESECLIWDAVGAALRKHGLQLQAQKNTLFASSKKSLDVTVLPWMAQKGLPPTEPVGPDAAFWRELSAALKEAAASLREVLAGKADCALLSGFWVSGGAKEERFHCPRLFQVLKGGDALFEGLAEASGMARHNIERLGIPWKSTEPVSRIAVFEAFSALDPAQNPEAFLAAWEKALAECASLIEELKEEKDYRFFLVASSGAVLQNMEIFPPSGALLSFFSKKKEALTDWIYLSD